MSWISIVLWLLTNLPELIALLRLLFGKKTMTPVAKENLRQALSRVIQDRHLARSEKKAQVASILRAYRDH